MWHLLKNIGEFNVLALLISLSLVSNLISHSYVPTSHHSETASYSYLVTDVGSWSAAHEHHDIHPVSADTEQNKFNHGHEHHALLEDLPSENSQRFLIFRSAIAVKLTSQALEALYKPPRSLLN